MNTLHFWLGFFAGITAITVFLILSLRGRRMSEECRKYNDETLRLMAERNDTDSRIALSLRQLADKHG
jgi:hypothetical protein